MTAETLRVRVDIACVLLHMHMGRYDHPEVVLTLSDFKVIPLNHRFERRIKRTATSVAVSSFELNQRVLLLHLCIRT
jgi:hypothetical protein